MTLVLVIPTVAGLIVAADSRLGISTPDWTIVCDNVFKITEVEGVDRTVVFTTGYGTIWALAGVQTDKVCEHVASNKPKFDAQAILANTARGPGASLEDIAREVVLATAAYIASHPRYAHYNRHGLCGLCQWNSSSPRRNGRQLQGVVATLD
ncbi:MULTISPECIES: hypothetical protein [unclassified Bradyrhizobium]|uniref:hypothetical protein n=1 Tax=unclassified Bradyrhizobium TaxID=2631580 RepID=UPI001FF8EC1E|nr:MULTISPECIES: hypothetical protein [unclassified Bradyrhizobium]MCK1431194.1 hypothetical protein [Bradyrhizobium sp. 87]MCK1535909.1 hypothetical protein [Bradyrhizobium sp. 176]MCK1555675.1 hypothetical protein [Bradyrhizobium sp. 171]